MRTYKFIVYFVGNTSIAVNTIGARDAVILACAERIQRGLHTNCFMVKNEDTNETKMISERNSVMVNWE